MPSSTSESPLSWDGTARTFRQVFRRLLGYGVIVSISLISFITVMGLWTSIHLFPPVELIDPYTAPTVQKRYYDPFAISHAQPQNMQPVFYWRRALHLMLCASWVYLILYHYLSATLLGPGFVPLDWHPEQESDKKFVSYCYDCHAYKAPRAHHCRSCNRCVKKMDHHCPWINTCVGHRNHAHFILFLLSTVGACLHAFVLFVYLFYYFLAVDPAVLLTYDTQTDRIGFRYLFGLASFFAAGFAIGVMIAVGFLFCVQMKAVIDNETGIETWILYKARCRIAHNHNAAAREREAAEAPEANGDSAPVPQPPPKSGFWSCLRRKHKGANVKQYKYPRITEGSPAFFQCFPNPYHLGWKRNISEVLSFSGRVRSDQNGLQWPVIEGCDQFTLTREQIQQKLEKAKQSEEYRIVLPYRSPRCPWPLCLDALLGLGDPRKSVSLRTWMATPLPIFSGPLFERADLEQCVTVTRWRKHWLYVTYEYSVLEDTTDHSSNAAQSSPGHRGESQNGHSSELRHRNVPTSADAANGSGDTKIKAHIGPEHMRRMKGWIPRICATPLAPSSASD